MFFYLMNILDLCQQQKLSMDKLLHHIVHFKYNLIQSQGSISSANFCTFQHLNGILQFCCHFKYHFQTHYRNMCLKTELQIPEVIRNFICRVIECLLKSVKISDNYCTYTAWDQLWAWLVTTCKKLLSIHQQPILQLGDNCTRAK